MYQDYLNDVIKYYRAGEKNADLPQRLMHPTPGSIKDECLSVCKTRFQKKDLRTLVAFFTAENDQDAMLRAIRRCERDRFKPLANFLRGMTRNTDDLNIELLAWLVDFPHRPFRAEDYPGAQEISEEIRNNSEGEETEAGHTNGKNDKAGKEDSSADPMPGTNSAGTHHTENKISVVKTVAFRNMRRRVAIAAMGALVLILVSFYFFMSRGTSFNASNKGPRQGMIWAGYHYAPASFEQRAASFIPYNDGAVLPYARCTGGSPCLACGNCNNCNYCNSGGACSVCASAPKKKTTQKRALQCQATTKKGKQCSRAAKEGSKYCWQHGK